ncbi:MAG: NADH-quinone oxidoreductase subunit M [Chitinophagales bacterium]|nr:NADH-quinone oxidoreductase subunit M [Chitinophagales bacterium]
MNLSFLILIPVITLLAMLIANSKQAKAIALAGSVIQLLFSIALAYFYTEERNAGNESPLLFEFQHDWFTAWNITYHVGVDGISIAMILLTSVVLLTGVLISWKVKDRVKEFFFLLVFLAASAFGFIISMDLFTLFFFFELAVIPKYLLIAKWGSGNKEDNAMKLALMLMGGSALVLIGILGTYYYSAQTGAATFDLVQLSKTTFSHESQMFLFPMMFMGFGVLSALFPFHTWAPEGHSSAPTAASMFLAGISMKLGGYGCLRVATVLFPEAAQAYSSTIIVLACIGILYGAFVTLRQTDLKMMNAYSSVSHCGFVLLGIGMLTKTAITGAVLQMVSHGIMTALFFAVIGMLYERTHTRIGSQMGGLMKVMPFIGTVFIIAGLTSLGLPGFSGFVAEMTVFVGSFQHNDLFHRIATIVATMSIVVTAVYILRAVGIALWGPITKEEFKHLTDATWNEKLAAIILVSCIVIIGVLPFWLVGIIQSTTQTLFGSILP